ncbi:MAG: tRNA (uridine(54)-C5)-methyltransferase TrmA [Sulfurospirillum sp.]|nr:MAG: tRNA (uridine(54)-C5)-methyltransferase TrmA [Sulfurospirillum sp.]
MDCNYFGKCGSCSLYQFNYEEQLSYKVEEAKELLSLKDAQIIRSKPSHFRNRAEFRIWHEDNKIFYAMHSLQEKSLLKIDSCQIVSEPIYHLMPKLIEFLKKSEILSHKLFTIEFLSSTTGNIMATLIYHKKIDETWLKEAKKIEDEFDITVIGRSRGVKLILSCDYIDETLTIFNKEFKFRLYESGFIQPNLKVNEKMIEWVLDNLGLIKNDLLELYCGHGNFTIPLSSHFNKVLATEVSKASIKAASWHKELNRCENISFARLSSQEFVQAYNKEREFRRLKDIDLDSFSFSHILVDPPRSGLDEMSLELVKEFDNIIYISCNPTTLKRDLEKLKSTHKIVASAFFDQFAYTNHLESGLILQKKSL